jgi:hypothetical protein
MMRPVFSSAMDYLLEVEESKIEEELILYPNPASTEINFSFIKEGTLEIIASDGKIILSLDWTNQVSVADLTNGFYFIRVTSADGQFQKIFKIIKS